MKPVHIAQISDLHVRPPGTLAYGISETNLYLEHAVHRLLRLGTSLDAVLVTGDLTDCGLQEEFAIVQWLLARLPVPVYAIPGNHDGRQAFRAAFAGAGYLPQDGSLNYVAEVGPVRIVALDSVVEGESHGAVTEGTLRFLEQALDAAPGVPAIVMLHHPPFETGIAHMDKISLLEGRDVLEAVISRRPWVARVLCGHVHRPIQRLFGGTLCQVAPSVAHQVAFDLSETGPSQFVLEPPAFLLHCCAGSNIVTHTVAIDRAPGPFPFVALDP
jgi:3',5'-cyclic AMP phosphodiesterase CpdA